MKEIKVSNVKNNFRFHQKQEKPTSKMYCATTFNLEKLFYLLVAVRKGIFETTPLLIQYIFLSLLNVKL